MIRFPLTSASQGWTNPVPSAFIHTSSSPTLLSCWDCLRFFSSSKSDLGTYWSCWVRHKTQPCKKWPVSCFLQLKAALQQWCKNTLGCECCTQSLRLPGWHSSALLSTHTDTHAHTKSLPWKSGLIVISLECLGHMVLIIYKDKSVYFSLSKNNQT